MVEFRSGDRRDEDSIGHGDEGERSEGCQGKGPATLEEPIHNKQMPLWSYVDVANGRDKYVRSDL